MVIPRFKYFQAKGGNMFKNIVCIMIYLSMSLPAALFAGALERYNVPQQKSLSAAQPNTQSSHGYVSEDVYDRFKNEIQGYSRGKKDKLKTHFRTQLNKASS